MKLTFGVRWCKGSSLQAVRCVRNATIKIRKTTITKLPEDPRIYQQHKGGKEGKGHIAIELVCFVELEESTCQLVAVSEVGVVERFVAS